MWRYIRKTIKAFFIFLTIPVALFFLLACIASYINPNGFWIAGIASLLLPYLAAVLILAFMFWLVMKPLWALIPLISLLLGWKQLSAIFAINFSTMFTTNMSSNQGIRVISWNVGSMYGTSNNSMIKNQDRKEIAQTIINMHPDIICLQEFNHSETQGEQANNIGLFSEIYPYYYFSKDLDKRNGFYQSGSIIFSKYPIIDSAKIVYPKNISESFIYTDILYNMDTLRVYNIHLQSYKFSEEDYNDINAISQKKDSTLTASKGVLIKMKNAFKKRGVQAKLIRENIDNNQHKYVLCGDFNDVPASYTYTTIRAKAQDAFLKKSWGVGRTFYSLAPTLRIDFILPDNHFKITQFDLVDEDLSDHLLLVSDMYIK